MSEDKFRRELAELSNASRQELIERWRRVHKCEPPRYASLEFLRRAAVYALQERELGGLPATARRELLSIAKGKQESKAFGQVRIKPGTRLLREWHGETHEVIVTDQGFVWGGTTYRSLSSVARGITGIKWNGPRFFGLTNRRGGKYGSD